MFVLIWDLLGIQTSGFTEYQISQVQLACAYATIVFVVVLVVVLIDLLYRIFDRIVSVK